MDKTLKLIIALISSVVLGVNFIQAWDKPFVDGDYYQIQIGKADYRGTYATINNRSLYSDGVSCDLTPLNPAEKFGGVRMSYFGLPEYKEDLHWIHTFNREKSIDSGLGDYTVVGTNILNTIIVRNKKLEAGSADEEFGIYPVYLNPQFKGAELAEQEYCLFPEVTVPDDTIPYMEDPDFPFTVSKKFPLLTTALEDKRYVGQYIIVPVGTEVIAPSEFYLINYNSDVRGAYPETGFTSGVHATGYIIDSHRELLFEITFSSLDRLWCCRNKEPADTDTITGPRHDNEDTDVKIIHQSCVIGFAGLSGLPKQGYGGLNREELSKAKKTVIKVSVNAASFGDLTSEEQKALITRVKEGKRVGGLSWSVVPLSYLYEKEAITLQQ